MTRPAHARSNGPTGESEAPRDDVLLDAAHSGDADAFGALRERYHGTALAVARSRTGSAEEAETVAAAALGRIEQIVGEGGGPRAFLGAFVVWMVGREADGGTRPVALPDDPGDPTSLVRVFSGLPAEWQAFLWRTEVLGHSARRAAGALGLGAVAAAGLHRDMVRGLRGLYDQAAADRAAGPDCAEFSGELPHFVRGTRGRRSRRDVKEHLDGCARCTAEYLGRQDVGTGLRTWTLPVLAGLPLWGTEALELTNLIAGAGAAADAGAGTGAAAVATGAAAGAAGALAAGDGTGAAGARPDGAAGTSPWAGRRTKVLLGAGALATAVAVAAVGVSGGGDPVPAADSLVAEQAPRTAEDLENPRADDPAAGAERTEDDGSGAGASASERDPGSSRSDEAAAAQDSAGAAQDPAGAAQDPAGAAQGGSGPEAAALVTDADRGDAGAAEAGSGGVPVGASGASGGDGATRPGTGGERPASAPGGSRAAETGTPGAESTGGAAGDTSSGGAPVSGPPARMADAPTTPSTTAPSPARETVAPSPAPPVASSLPTVVPSPAPLKAPVPPVLTIGPPNEPARAGAAPGDGRQYVRPRVGAPVERGSRLRESGWNDGPSHERKHAGRHGGEHPRGQEGTSDRPGGGPDQRKNHTHR